MWKIQANKIDFERIGTWDNTPSFLGHNSDKCHAESCSWNNQHIKHIKIPLNLIPKTGCSEGEVQRTTPGISTTRNSCFWYYNDLYNVSLIIIMIIDHYNGHQMYYENKMKYMCFVLFQICVISDHFSEKNVLVCPFWNKLFSHCCRWFVTLYRVVPSCFNAPPSQIPMSWIIVSCCF